MATELATEVVENTVNAATEQGAQGNQAASAEAMQTEDCDRAYAEYLEDRLGRYGY